jgi:CTD nuclear envelope phosphatase 1
MDDALQPLDPQVKGSNDTDAQNKDPGRKEDTMSVPYIVRMILFIPNILVVRPVLFFWFVITFPLSLLENKQTTEEQQIATDKGPEPQQEKKAAARRFSTAILELDEDSETMEPSHTDGINLKSPTSPSSMLNIQPKRLAFPKTVFPQALVNSESRKTLILDLDETLVHSLSRGARMSNGHMIEIKLADQVATLYSVHKRPYCDHFLKQVSMWFDLVIFTASVKEYADPVIDWLESERKYFSKRFYRNHCTLREGQGYIKDLSTVDANLNHLLIIDNSPISYAWHANNAITVEGWINDATDTDLLNLIPLLKAMRYTTDVRTVLSLKNGEAAFEK